MRFLAELFEVPATIGARPTDIYWYQVGHEGTVEFYSNRPSVTRAIERRLEEGQHQGLLTQAKPGPRSVLSFYGRVFSGLSSSVIGVLRGKQ